MYRWTQNSFSHESLEPTSNEEATHLPPPLLLPRRHQRPCKGVRSEALSRAQWCLPLTQHACAMASVLSRRALCRLMAPTISTRPSLPSPWPLRTSIRRTRPFSLTTPKNGYRHRPYRLRRQFRNCRGRSNTTLKVTIASLSLLSHVPLLLTEPKLRPFPLPRTARRGRGGSGQ